MANPISGRNAYAYFGGKAVAHLKDWTATVSDSIILLDPDIGSSWQSAANGFLSIKGTINYNFSSDDFPNVFDALTAGAAVSLYLYPESGASKPYMYGSAFLTDMGHNNTLSGTVTGSFGFTGNGTWARQTTAA